MISREPTVCASERHDLIVIGGGIYGAMLALESTRYGLRPLLLERADFGGATSWNSLRIAHGGLRYLQTLDFPRFRESVGERGWLMATFPELVRPLPCLLPLYGRGLRRSAVLRPVLALNDILSRRRDAGAAVAPTLPDGSILGPSATRQRFPTADPVGLQGGALWFDGVITSTQRLLMEVLRWAAAAGARMLNYVECTDLLSVNQRVTGVRAWDHRSGAEIDFRTDLVINAAGPWSLQVGAAAGPRVPRLFRPSLAFNALLDQDPPADLAVAVAPPRPGGRTYFLYPCQGRLIAGTFHAPWTGTPDNPQPDEELLADFLTDLNEAIPGLGLRRDQVIRVLAGLLPAVSEGGDTLAVREVIHDHGSHGGVRGIYSVSGIKYTTARLVAEKTLRLIFRGRPARRLIDRPAPVPQLDVGGMLRLLNRDREEGLAYLSRLVQEEAVQTTEDLLLRRTDWGLIPNRGAPLAELVAEIQEPPGGWMKQPQDRRDRGPG